MSSTVKSKVECVSCGTTAIRRANCSRDIVFSETPSSAIWPRAGVNVPASSRRNVVLPDPFGPNSDDHRAGPRRGPVDKQIASGAAEQRLDRGQIVGGAPRSRPAAMLGEQDVAEDDVRDAAGFQFAERILEPLVVRRPVAASR